MSSPIAIPRVRFFTADGAPLFGGLLYSYEAGTTTPLATYTSAAGDVSQTNPVVLSANGEAEIWLGDATAYKFVLTNAVGVVQWTVDNVSSIKKLTDAVDSQLRADLASRASATKGAGMSGYDATREYAAGTVGAKLGELVSVKDYGALGEGGDDMSALSAASAAAAAAGRTLFFPDGVYGITDTFYFEDGIGAFFAPNAWLKLLNSTSTGGAVSVSYPTQTAAVEIHNLGVDCSSIAGENGIGIGHVVGSRLINPRVKNVLHSSSTYGGKAIQLEGTEALGVQVIAPNIENCSVGIDIGAVDAKQTVHVSFFDVTMRNVDIPVYVNDTNTSTPSGSLDQMEVLIDGLHCRNCGYLTFTGATGSGGGIIVSDRGFGLTVRNVQVVNDRGGYGSTGYNTIGALVRGQGKGIVLDNVLIDADMVALFDHNPAAFQSPFAGDVASTVLADRIRHYGNLDYVVKCLPGGGKMGASLMRGIEIGGTAASLAGIVDTNAAAYTGAFLEVINRDNLFLSSGLKSLSDLNALGNALDTKTQGLPAPAQMLGSWTPIDGSPEGLVFTGAEGWWVRMGQLVIAMGTATYPATADAANSAVIGGLPFTVRNENYARYGSAFTISSLSAVKRIYPAKNGTTAPLLSDTSAAVTNAQCSGGLFGFLIVYLT